MSLEDRKMMAVSASGRKRGGIGVKEEEAAMVVAFLVPQASTELYGGYGVSLMEEWRRHRGCLPDAVVCGGAEGLAVSRLAVVDEGIFVGGGLIDV